MRTCTGPLTGRTHPYASTVVLHRNFSAWYSCGRRDGHFPAPANLPDLDRSKFVI